MKKVRLFLSLLILLAIGLTSTGCSSKDNPIIPPTQEATVPMVTTIGATDIHSTTASAEGSVVKDGGSTITSRGTAWSTNTNPTINDNKTVDGTGVGTFISNINGLKPNTTYYSRAYATNSTGIGYGEPVSFTTSSWKIGDTCKNGIIWKIDSVEKRVWCFIKNVTPQKWDAANTTAESMGGILASVSQSLEMYALKVVLGLSDITYWSCEVSQEDNEVLCVVFNYNKDTTFNGTISHTSKESIFPSLIVFSFQY